MRKFPALLLAPVLPVLLAAAVLGACGGGGDTAAHEQGPRSPDPSTSSARETTSTTAEPEAVVPAQAADASSNPVGPAPAPTPRPSGGGCDAAAVHEAIRNSDAVAPDSRFELTYLECADGYGWAQIMGEHGDGATVLFAGSGADITLLNLGSSLCATDSLPASTATRLAPAGSNWQGDCPPGQ
jgi:hypothetical protein